MHSYMAERIAYGRKIQEHASGFLTSFGTGADRAAWDYAGAAGLTDEEKAFRLAVSARVARLLGTPSDQRVA